MVVARQTGGSPGTAGDSAGWIRDMLFRRGASRRRPSPSIPARRPPSRRPSTTRAAAAWRVAFSADTTNGGIAVAVTGEAGKSINWVARIMSVEVVG